MLQKFLKYVLQSVAGMIGISIYILADTYFISVYSGADGLAVLNLILPVYGLMFAIGSMIGIGSATRYRISRARGETADFYFMQAVIWTLFVSVPFMIVGITAPDKLLGLLGADTGLVRLGRNYLRIVLIAAPFFMLQYTFTAFARNDNAPSTAMMASIAGSMFNILFDYIFMFPMKMGFPGAALATAMSPVITMAVCSTHYFSKKNQVPFRIGKLSLRQITSCCQLGISAFVGEISSAVITIVFNMLVLGIAGNIGIAAYGVVANLSAVAMSIFNGMAQGVQPLISESYGKGEGELVRKLLRWGICTCLLLEIIVVGSVFGMTDMLIGIFNSEENRQLISYAHPGLRLYFLGFLIAGINILLVAYFSAVDDALPAIIGSLMRGAVAIIICAVVLAHFFGMNGVWISFLASEVITFCTILIISHRKHGRSVARTKE